MNIWQVLAGVFICSIPGWLVLAYLELVDRETQRAIRFNQEVR